MHSQAAHSNLIRHGKGRGLKANDAATFPLCCTRIGDVGCHVRHDQLIGMSRDEADRRTDSYIQQTILKLLTMKKLTGSKDVLAEIKLIGYSDELTVDHLIGLMESGELKAVK